MKILIYATTFGADLWSFAKYVDQRPDTEVEIIMPRPELYYNEGVADLFPLKAPVHKRSWYHNFASRLLYGADVTIMDNHLPLFATSPHGLMLWHGYGWKGPNDEEEFKWLHRSITLAWGDAKKQNDRFRWQCFGPYDYEHRTKVSGFAPENCRVLGAASHDDLIEPLDRSLAQPYYPFDVSGKPTVLIAPTWHYGDVLEHWGKDKELFPKLIQHITAQGANIILRLHDSFRFDKEHIDFLRYLDSQYDNLFLKFKDKSQDNYLDMQVADLLITNFSSIANLFYATGRPTIHIYPVNDADEKFMWKSRFLTGFRVKEVESVKYIWKFPPEENGGLLATNFDMLLDQISHALHHPDCCREKAKNFLDKHMLGADGRNCERIWNSLLELTGRPYDKELLEEVQSEPSEPLYV